MKRIPHFAIAAALAALCSGAALADTIYLKNGQKFEGKVVVKGDQVILLLESGTRLPFPKDRVDRIERGPAPWELYAVKAKKLKSADAAGHLELAKWCGGKKLYKRKKKHLAAVVKLDPDNAEAHRLLGHERYGGKWLTREEALKAKGWVQVEGRWLNPEEYALYLAKKGAKDTAEKELRRLRQLADRDPKKAAAARKFYLDRGRKSIQNLIWGAMNLKDSGARLAAIKLLDQLRPSKKVHSLWLTQAALKESNTACLKALCAGIKKRDDATAMTYLVLMAASKDTYRSKAAYCLRLIHDRRCYKALIGCVARSPKDTLPGQMGLSLNQMGNMAGGAKGVRGGGMSVQGGEVVPAADSLEFISGKGYRNDVGKWLKWLDSLDRAPGGAVVAPRK